MFDKDNEESEDQTFAEEVEESSDQTEESADEGEQEETDQADEQSNFVEINGEKVSLEELKNGYLREADYRRKTQALAKERSELAPRSNPVDERTPQEVEALKALDKLGVAKRSDVENIVRSMMAQQQIVSEREMVRSSTGLEDDMLDAAQFYAIRNGISLAEAATKFSGNKVVVKKKSVSVSGGTTSPPSAQKGGKPTPDEIRKMDPNSKEFEKVVEMMSRGEL